MHKLDRMMALEIREPEVLGCVYVTPLNDIQFETNFWHRNETRRRSGAHRYGHRSGL
jgi:hypothetical protein